jgi:hypothetical protein
MKASGAPAAASLTARWLRADLRDVVRVVPAQGGSRRAQAHAGGLQEDLARWSGRLARRRAIALVRRYFLVAIAIVVAAEIVAILVAHGHRPVWLIAPLLLALAGGVVALWQGVPARDTARILDDALKLHQRLETALELRDTRPRLDGLAALVVDEADAAADESLETARAAGRRSRAEWSWLLAGVAALAISLAVPGVGHSSSARHAAEAATAHTRSGGSPPRGLQLGSKLTRSRPSGPAHGAPTLPTGASLSGGAANLNPHAAPNGDYKLYGGGGHMTAQQVKQMAQEGLASGQRAAGVGGATAAAGAGSSGGGGTSGAMAGPGGSGSSNSLSELNGGALPTPSAEAAPTNAAAGGPHGSSTPSRAAESASPGRGYGGQANGTSGGESAGNTRGTPSLRVGVVPDLTGTSALPLLAGLAPSSSSRSSARQGISQTPNGGGGTSRTAQVGGTIGGTGNSGTSFAVIPPSLNSAGTAAPSLLEGYFGSADQREFPGW